MRSRWLRASLAAALPLCLAAGVHAEDKKSDPVTPVRPADAPGGLKFTGRVEASAWSALSARVAGAVEKVLVNEGDRVKKGQVLIELSAPELLDDLDQAKAEVEQAKAGVERAGAAAQQAKAQAVQADAALDAVRAAVRRARAAAEQAQAEMDRLRKLGDANAVSREEVEAHGRQADAAKAAVEEAEAQAKAAEAAREVAAAEVAGAQAGVKVAQAGAAVAEVGVRRAQTRLGYLQIRAPFDGVVAQRTAEVGATVGPPRQGEAAPLVSVMRNEVVRVVFDVAEKDAPRLAVGAPAVIRAPALEGVRFDGKVTWIAVVIDPHLGTLRAEVELPNGDGKLRPGMFVTVDVIEDKPGK